MGLLSREEQLHSQQKNSAEAQQKQSGCENPGGLPRYISGLRAMGGCMESSRKTPTFPLPGSQGLER